MLCLTRNSWNAIAFCHERESHPGGEGGREGEGPPLYITSQILVFPILTVLHYLLKTHLQECDMSKYQTDSETDTHNVTLCHTYKLGLTVSIVIARCAELRGEAFLLLVFTFPSSRIAIHNLSRAAYQYVWSESRLRSNKWTQVTASAYTLA